MEETYLLVKLDTLTDGEVSLRGYWLTTSEEYKDFLYNLQTTNVTPDIEVYVSENDFFCFENLDQLLDSLGSTEITKDFYMEAKQVFGDDCFGTINIPYLLEIYEDE